MQIVRDLGGYTMGRADLVRRAMSKKKHDVMNAERQNFVYGNEAEKVPGCAAAGISAETANQIFDTMTAFASYAFNKSHAAAYAVVAYETAWLKYYYPKEFMAALMTSVIENSGKVSEYIYTCRLMGIGLLPPDLNLGRGEFSVQDGQIRYGLNAVKGIGKAVVSEIVSEREKNGRYTSLQNFCERLSTREVNKKTIENFIKAGAFDGFGFTRKQQMYHYPAILSEVEHTRKDSLSGQFSLFGFGDGFHLPASSAEITYPNVGEYDKAEILAFEKEVLGIYVSGHPLEADEDLLKKNVTASSSDFIVDEEEGKAGVADNARVTVGGMVTGKTVKTTKSNQLMAFVTLEDMIGSVEVIIFPKDYERYKMYLNDDEKILVSGRASIGDDPVGKLVLESLTPFEQVPRELWLQFEDKADYDARFDGVRETLLPYDGNDALVIYLKKEKQFKKMPPSMNISVQNGGRSAAVALLGKDNVRVVAKTVGPSGRR